MSGHLHERTFYLTILVVICKVYGILIVNVAGLKERLNFFVYILKTIVC